MKETSPGLSDFSSKHIPSACFIFLMHECRERNVSPDSSVGLRTPENLFYPHDHSHDNFDPKNAKRATFLSQTDSSLNSSNNAGITSLEVELSRDSDNIHPAIMTSPYLNSDPETPQRASQIFHFLMEKRKPKDLRSLPALPPSTASSSSSKESLLLPASNSEVESKIPRLRHELDVAPTKIPRARGRGLSFGSQALLAEPHLEHDDYNPFKPSSSRAHRRISSYADANVVSCKKYGDENLRTRSPSVRRKPVPQFDEDCSTRK